MMMYPLQLQYQSQTLLLHQKKQCKTCHETGKQFMLQSSTNFVEVRNGRSERGEYIMSRWVLKSADGTTSIDFNNDDATGSMLGTLVFEGATYHITGNWAASGSIPGRNFSAFALWGSDQNDATVYVAVAGLMTGPGGSPESVQLSLTRTSTSDGEMYGWDGQLLPG